MADLSDVQDAIAAIIAGVMYPNGTGQPPAIACPTVRIYAGWPQSAALDKDLRAKVVNISIFGERGEKNATRYFREWREVCRQANTITATVEETQVTLAGTIATPQNVAVFLNGKVYIHGVQTSDTLATIAAGLATLISVDTPATSSGAVLTVAGVEKVVVGRDGTLAREIRRQEKHFMITVWAPNDELRRSASKAIDAAISPIDQMALIDGSYGRVTYVRSSDEDNPQEALLYRRDIVFAIEYPTLEFTEATAVLGISVAQAAQYVMGGITYAQSQSSTAGA